MKYPKRLIEVDLPIKRISAHARREKSIRHGHISTLHIWWARRPLASSRAILLAALWPDPADHLCPPDFVKAAREEMQTWGKNDRLGLLSPESIKNFIKVNHHPAAVENAVFLRRLLLDFIADFANWDNSIKEEYLQTARKLTQTAHEALGGQPGSRPLVADPFAGGGSIPLEALRVGADAFASDLNPIPVLLNKVQLEYIPKYGKKLADEVRKWGDWIKEEAQKQLKQYYPDDEDLPAPRRDHYYVYVLKCSDNSFYIGQTNNITKRLMQHERGEVSWTAKHLPVEIIHWEGFDTRQDAVKREQELKTGFGRKWLKREFKAGRLSARQAGGSTPIAYIWARTIQCEGPGCGAEVPLMRSMWLAKKKGHNVALRMVPDAANKRVDLEIMENAKAGDLQNGTVQRGNATCPVCGFTTPVASVRRQMKAKHGGADQARLVYVVTTNPKKTGRAYRLPQEKDVRAFEKAKEELLKRIQQQKGDISLIPDEPTPAPNGHRAVSSVQIYGFDTFADLFSSRQLLVLTTLVELVKEAGECLRQENEKELADAVQTCLALALDSQADSNSSLCAWRPATQDIGHTFGRQALPMMWDFVEVNIFSGATRDWNSAINGVLKAINSLDNEIKSGNSYKQSATLHPLPDDSAEVFFTDPPYYDAVPYADLSDFFYVWLKRTLNNVHPALFAEELANKEEECIVDEIKGKDKAYFESEMQKAMAEGRRITKPEGIGMVVFAHKTTGGWEAQLQSMLNAGWVFTASWPIDTEMGSRLRAMNSAALASSVHLVCRPRENPDGSLMEDHIGDWRDVQAELPQRIKEWMPRLAKEGVVGADAIFACLGPALEVFSRYSRVEKPDGTVVTLRDYLERVWAAVSQEALNMVFAGGDAGNLEEDARVTAMWLWTLAAGANGNGTESAAEESGTVKISGYTLEYDTARKIAQGLGANLDNMKTLVEIKGDQARLLPVHERAEHLFGGGSLRQSGRRKKEQPQQLALFAEMTPSGEELAAREIQLKMKEGGKTVLDRLHQAMLLFGTGRTEALKRFLSEEGAGQDDRFWRLAQALTALYPKNTDERRWVEAVQTYKKSLGF